MFGILVIPILVSIAGEAMGSDVNWGKKVPCFEQHGTVVCPGCNYRAGLSCPRALKNSPSCPEENSETEPREEPTRLPRTTQDEDIPIEEEEISIDLSSTSTPFSDPSPTTALDTTSTDAPATSPSAIEKTKDLAFFLNEILKNRNSRHWYRILKREVKTAGNETILGEICNWNADCLCPQICCSTGRGCAKRCVMGIRLPPPWGK